MMINKIYLATFFLLLSPGCTDFFVEISKDDIWMSEEYRQIKLLYRPENHSSQPSPDKTIINNILFQQNLYIRRICDSIKMTYNGNVLIYLYNSDESEEKIGTRGGGHAIPNFLCFYYTYHTNLAPYTDQYGMENPPLGAHEIAHVLSHHLLGTAGTKLMSEGYAVWLEGGYGRRLLRDIIKLLLFEPDHSDILSPTQMLKKTDYKEEIYYPNAGMFVHFLVNRYGINIANKLFTIPKDLFILEFRKLTSVDFNFMEEDYQNFLKKL